jgi:micrococcal nuclease
MRMHRPNHLLALFLFAYALLLSSCSNESLTASPNSATLKGVVDGDTIDIAIGGKTERVRLIGINTPETKHPTKGVECYGPEASAYTEQLLPKGTKLRVERDVEARDKYGRLLLYVYIANSNVFVNMDLVMNGYARPMVFEPNTAHRADFAQAATQAELRNVGLWQACR